MYSPIRARLQELLLLILYARTLVWPQVPGGPAVNASMWVPRFPGGFLKVPGVPRGSPGLSGFLRAPWVHAFSLAA